MAVSDPIAHLLTKIRNAGNAEHRYVDANWSVIKESICSILKNEGFITDYVFAEIDGIKHIRVYLKYTKERKPVIQVIKRASTPGKRKYVSAGELKSVYGGMGISIVSTSQGILKNKDAKEKNIGGELLCYVW